jgi:membrane-associated phospholipid phosphatase
MHAPLRIRQFALAHAAVIGVALIVTLQWKISLHCAGAAGIATLLTGVLGIQGMVAFTSVAMVAWSRIRLGRHTISQALAGSVLGTLVFFLALAMR